MREEVFGTNEYDSYQIVTTTFDSWCDLEEEPNCVAETM